MGLSKETFEVSTEVVPHAAGRLRMSTALPSPNYALTEGKNSGDTGPAGHSRETKTKTSHML